MPNYGRERLNSRFSITMHRTQYLESNKSRTQGVNDTNDLNNARLGGVHAELWELNTQDLELEDTSPIKDTQFMEFMRNLWT
ncbi:hypothetical protein MTR67_052107 [Solanum verrucosum]|uniref:Uncharacterized protein n=1 Tax=Solanum verrucosum TaxID=315347 RepID=A0AAF0V6A9_SOLVR|nr:hypothetical protein MTR67_052107 [Solanum verrucosum]